jgi:hypothetical protein
MNHRAQMNSRSRLLNINLFRRYCQSEPNELLTFQRCARYQNIGVTKPYLVGELRQSDARSFSRAAMRRRCSLCHLCAVALNRTPRPQQPAGPAATTRRVKQRRYESSWTVSLRGATLVPMRSRRWRRSAVATSICWLDFGPARPRAICDRGGTKHRRRGGRVGLRRLKNVSSGSAPMAVTARPRSARSWLLAGQSKVK